MAATQAALQVEQDDTAVWQKRWREYKKTGGEALRNMLIEHYMPSVRHVAERMRLRLPEEIDLDFLISAGTLGLMGAIEHFDMDRNVKFETYCAPRIHGAILDELRSLDWVPRLVRSRTAQIERVRRRLEMEHGRPPTDDEVAEVMGLEGEAFDRVLRDGRATQVVSLQRRWHPQAGEESRDSEVIRDQRQPDPAASVIGRDLRDEIIRNLSRPERLIVILYYYEQMTMKEIGLTLDLSESRVSQMHSSILARLKAQLQGRQEELGL